MPIRVTVPRLGWTMEEGIFVGWLKKDGEPVRAGEPLFTLAGDKATQEIEATDSGILRISSDAPKAGGVVRVGALLGYLVAEGEPSPSLSTPPFESAAQQLVVSLSSPGTTAAEIERKLRSSETLRQKVPISPRAMRAATELGVDWTKLRGTGRSGRIRERDILAAVAITDWNQGQRQGNISTLELPGRLIAISPTRRTIARRLSAAFHETVPVTLTTRADATNLVRARQELKAAAAASGGLAPTFTDFFVKLCAVALQQHPLLNAQWREDGIFVPDQINIAIAVETDSGLVAPVIHDVATLTIQAIAAASYALVAQARTGGLPADKQQGATFTVTNLGGLGIDVFTPIINLPQCAVLGVGRITREPVVEINQIVPRDVVSLSLTFDHRIVDGAPAARFLETLRQYINEPGPCIS